MASEERDGTTDAPTACESNYERSEEAAMVARVTIWLLAASAVAACAPADESSVDEALGEVRGTLVAQAAVEQDLALQGAILLDPRVFVSTRRDPVLPQMLEVLVRGWGVEPTDDCTAIVPSWDGDGDGVSSVTRIRFDCRNFARPDAVVTLLGDVDLVDENDRIAGDGWRLVFRGLNATRTLRSGETSALTIHGEVLFEVASPPSLFDGAAIHSTLEWRFAGADPDGSWADTRYEATYEGWYTPRPRASDPRAAGQLELDGTVHWQRNEAEWSPAVFTERPLVFDRTCKLDNPRLPGFYEGVVAYEDAFSVSRLRFDRCETWSVEP
jgi:hypothetical protein